MQRSSLQSEKGSVFLIVALCLAGFIALTAIVVDLTMAYSSQEQMRHTCEYASAAAAKAYMQTLPLSATPADQYNERLNNALARANAIVSNNKIISIIPGPDTFQALTLNTTGGPSGNSELIPGKWFTGSIALSQCGADPCFLPNNPAAPGFDHAADAFRCELRTAAPLQTLLGKVFGQSELNVTANATAKFRPLEMTFLVDLSQSITYGTHWPVVPTDPVFPTGLQNSTCPVGTFAATDYVLPIWGGSYSSAEIDQFKYAFSMMPNTRGSSKSAPFIHYKSDYALLYYGSGDAVAKCSPHYPASFTPSTVHKFPTNSLTGEVCYLVDTYSAGNPCGYSGPQPLTSVYNSINVASGIINNRSIKADRTGLIAFDDRVLTPQPPTTALRSYQLTKPADIASVVNVTNPVDQFQRYLITQPLSKTDIALALKNALDQLDTPARATKSVILFSDGLSNCAYSGANDGVTDNGPLNSLSLSGSKTCANVTASNWKDTFRDSYKTLMAVADVFASRGVKVYTIATGPWIMPGSYNYERPEYTQCCAAAGASCPSACAHIDRWMDFDEIKTLNDPSKPFTQFPSAHPRYNDPRSNGYQGPMQMLYKIAEKTSGKFYAVRPQGPSGCYDSRGIATCSNLLGDPRTSGSLQTIDTKNRDLSAQVADFVKEIVREEGLLLVEEG